MEPEKQKNCAGNALLIESNIFYRNIMMIFLQKLNYTVDLVKRNKEAVKMMLESKYNLIILGKKSNEIAPDDFISLVRESKNVGIPVIAWSEFIDEKNKGIYNSWKADEGLRKPCMINDLIYAINECSKLQPYEREYSYKRVSISEKWKKIDERLNFVEEVFHLSDVQLALLIDAVEIYSEYKLIDERSKSEQYEKKFLDRRMSIIEKWEKIGERLNFLEEVFCLSDVQLALLIDAVEIYSEYKLSRKADMTESLNL